MQIKTLISGSLVYLSASVLSSLLPFLLLPVLTRYIPPDEFGQLGIYQGMYTMFLALSGLGIAGAIVRQSYDVDRDEIAVYIFNALMVMAATTAFFAIVIFLAGDMIAERLNISFDLAYYALFAAASYFVLTVVLGQFQVHQKALQYGSVQVSHGILNFALSLLFVILLGWGALGRIYGITGAAILFGVLALVLLWRMGQISPRLNRDHMRDALAFGVPLLPHSLGTFFINWFSLFVLAAMVDDVRVGYYTFAFQISMLLGVTCDAFNRAYVPWLFGLLKTGDNNDKTKIVKVTYAYFMFLAVVVLSGFLFAEQLVALFFDAKYQPAAHLIKWLVLGQAFTGCYLMVTNYLFFHRKTGLLSVATLFSSATSVVLLITLVPLFGMEGAALSFISARLVSFLLTWILAIRFEKMPWFSILRRA